MTKHGPLDLLGAIGGGRGYEDLIPRTVEMRLGSLKVRVIDLDTLIELKETAGREKDKAVIAILKRTRDESRRSGG
jgi:predicted nucleotidyltransferase